jgi:beta-glucosidase
VKLVKAANPKTILIMVSSFPYAINWSKEHVHSILHITQSSQEMGSAMADVLSGKVSPSGRLVQTWITSIDLLPPILDYNIRNGRTYMYHKNEPLFPFGHGLTYTTFSYSDLKTDKQVLRKGEILNITFTIKNTGKTGSDEVAQLYASFPESIAQRPVVSLKGFKRIFIPAGKQIKVTIPVKADDLAYWDMKKNAWVTEAGKVTFFVGSSSADSRLNGSFKVE